MKKLSTDNWVVLGILATMVAAYFLVVHRCQANALDEVRTQTARRQRQLEEDALKATRVPPMVREIEAMKQRYNKDWDRRLPKRQELAGFLKEIASNLAQERLPNQITKPGKPTRGPLYNCLPITMEFEGNFLALAGFLKRVDAMTRLTRIEQLTIEPKKDEGAGPAGSDAGGPRSLSVVLGMNIYFTES